MLRAMGGSVPVALVSNVIAGALRDRLGATTTFYAGGAFGAATIVLLVYRHAALATNRS